MSFFQTQIRKEQTGSSLCTTSPLATARSHTPLVSRRHLLGWLNSDIRVPFPRGKHDDLVQKLIDPRDQILSIPGLVGHIAEELAGRGVEEERGPLPCCVPISSTSLGHTACAFKERCLLDPKARSLYSNHLTGVELPSCSQLPTEQAPQKTCGQPNQRGSGVSTLFYVPALHLWRVRLHHFALSPACSF